MKAAHVTIVFAALGVVLGAGISWANFGKSPPLFPPKATANRSTAPEGEQPRVVVDDRAHDFGLVERDIRIRHAFRFKNVGHSLLKLEAGVTTCTKCTIAELSKPNVEPGETVDVIVEYLTNANQPKFRQIAPILTNDPDQPRVELYISGTVSAKYRLVPEDVVLSRFSANETTTAQIKIYGLLSDEVRLVGHAFIDPETANYFEATSQPIPRDQLTEPGVKSGCRVLLTIKPGLPLGPLRQTIRLELQMGEGAEASTSTVEVPIVGTVDSDISIVGQGWDADQNRLSLGSIKSSRGATRKLLLLLRGDHRHDVKITPGPVDPAWLKVTLGEPTELKGGAVTQIPLTVEVPPGLPPSNHLGSDQGKYAEVVLETTHPQVKQIRLFLKFVIEQ
jgi:Protein of unknown function (DUF1573)